MGKFHNKVIINILKLATCSVYVDLLDKEICKRFSKFCGFLK